MKCIFLTVGAAPEVKGEHFTGASDGRKFLQGRRRELKILFVAGARPNFMKLSSILDAVRRPKRNEVLPLIVHTGQHYDENLSEVFFRDLGLPRPDVHLGVGSGTHAEQTGEIMKRFEPVLLEKRPDVVVVVGDVNSTVACSIVASKVCYTEHGRSVQRRPLIAHVEAGLRSFDRSMPEEINRILTDSVSDFLFVSEPSGRKNLLREGISPGKIWFVGNTMVDTLLAHRKRAEQSDVLERLGLRSRGRSKRRASKYAVVTLHRPSNVDDRRILEGILRALLHLSRDLPVLFAVHPRTRSRIREFGLDRLAAEVQLLEPLGYLDFLCLMSHARLVLTDSGGIQEETTALGVPCVTLRKNTERPITVSSGTNVLAGVEGPAILRAARRQLKRPLRRRRPKLWDGRAGARIVDILTRRV